MLKIHRPIALRFCVVYGDSTLVSEQVDPMPIVVLTRPHFSHVGKVKLAHPTCFNHCQSMWDPLPMQVYNSGLENISWLSTWFLWSVYHTECFTYEYNITYHVYIRPAPRLAILGDCSHTKANTNTLLHQVPENGVSTWSAHHCTRQNRLLTKKLTSSLRSSHFTKVAL